MMLLELHFAVVSFQYDYFFGEHLRWNLGFPTPNYAGAFIASAFPLLWGAAWYLKLSPQAVKNLNSIWSLLWFIGAEGAFAYVMGNTYSRGALLGAFIALVYFTFCQFLCASTEEHLTRSRILVTFSTRMLTYSLAIFPTGFFQRAEVALDGTDASVVNRLDLWRNCTEMVYAAPIQGWGSGESGRIYMNWYQDAFRSEAFMTPVNSYLHVAIEHGILLFSLCLLVLFAFLIRGTYDICYTKKGTLANPILAVSGASIVAYLVCNIFTTLWMDARLWLIPLAGYLSIIVRCIIVRQWKLFVQPLIYAGLITVVFSSTIYAYGYQRASKRRLTVNYFPNGVGLETSNAPTGGKRVVCALDEEVLGSIPGKEIRMWMLDNPDIKSVRTIAFNSQSNRIIRDIAYDDAIFFGRQSQIAEKFSNGNRIWFVHPIGAIPLVRFSSEVVVILPMIDQTGDAEQWRIWATANNAKIVYSEGVGLDIRPVWPQIMRVAI